jgi:hypothetical protein
LLADGVELITLRFIDGWNDRRELFAGTKPADQILARLSPEETSLT